MKSVKSLILSEMLSGSKAVKILKENHSQEVGELMEAVDCIQSFLGKTCIASQIVDNLGDLEPNEFVKWLDSQLPKSQQGKINGGNLCERIIAVAKRTAFK